ncbi:hypothetical protein D7V96_04600 [bacterium D16-59]|nr:hypothetical protein D7V96_04600 [bacterium D16-59]
MQFLILFPRRQSEDVQASLHHPSAPARVKYPPSGAKLAKEPKVPLGKLGHAPLLCSGVFDCMVKEQ